MFVVQNLAQLNEIYDKSWETFFGNSGLKLFFQIDDDFSRSYLSRQLGELETVRQTQSGSQAHSTSSSTSDGRSFSSNYGSSSGTSWGASRGSSWTYTGLFRFLFSKSRTDQIGWNRSRSRGQNWGRSRSTSFSTSEQSGDSTTSGWAEGVHKRPLLNPDEIGRLLARVDDRRRPGYPGLVLALVPGEHPLLARRVNYFESAHFAGYFDPHPNHSPPPTLAELAQRAAAGVHRLQPRARRDRQTGMRLSRLLSRLTLATASVLKATVALAGIAIGIGLGAAFYLGEPVTDRLIEAMNKIGQFTGTAPDKRPPTSVSALPSERPSSSVSPPDPAYAQGVADWDALQAWVTAQTGDRRAGVDYWSANRNVPGHASCDQQARTYSGNSAPFVIGCETARGKLAAIDTRRADPQYRSGFSDEAKQPKPEAQKEVAALRPPPPVERAVALADCKFPIPPKGQAGPACECRSSREGEIYLPNKRGKLVAPDFDNDDDEVSDPHNIARAYDALIYVYSVFRDNPKYLVVQSYGTKWDPNKNVLKNCNHSNPEFCVVGLMLAAQVVADSCHYED
jgi:hypothetical protein